MGLNTNRNWDLSSWPVTLSSSTALEQASKSSVHCSLIISRRIASKSRLSIYVKLRVEYYLRQSMAYKILNKQLVALKIDD